MSKFANYHIERKSFSNLFLQDCSRRILLIKGISGCGKTSLLSSCLMNESKDRLLVSIELRGSSVDVTEILVRTAKHIGWEAFPCFQRCAQGLVESAPNLNITGIKQFGQINTLRIALNVENSSEKDFRQALLTDAWFEDLTELKTPLVWIFDTFEQAPLEVQNWISGPFLARIIECPSLRAAIAGQKVPIAGIEWSELHTQHTLSGVKDPAEWLPVVAALGKVSPREPMVTYLGAVCDMLEGQPSEIMK